MLNKLKKNEEYDTDQHEQFIYQIYIYIYIYYS